ncbi:MAG: inner rane transporter RhtA, partial [Solirubrobacteraceae bacterium]|nr:inner rane transporter RhtA [Solirubrobacteraceae bacterium]
NAVALLLAIPGVYLLTGVRLAADPLGVALAFANATLFAAYIVLAHRVARHGEGGPGGVDGLDALAGAMLVAAIAVTPVAAWAVAPAAGDLPALAAGAGVGVCSSVVPYVLDQLAMRRLARAAYALMVSLLPATATVVGIAVLAQVPSPAELAGVALVIAGVAIHRDPRAPAGPAGAPAEADPAQRGGGAAYAPGRPGRRPGTSGPTEQADRAWRAGGGTAAAVPSAAPSSGGCADNPTIRA